MSHRALYRQYRPATFSEMIGQEHITTILKNQVKSGTTAHAYLSRAPVVPARPAPRAYSQGR